jgi:hypothetical protein
MRSRVVGACHPDAGTTVGVPLRVTIERCMANAATYSPSAPVARRATRRAAVAARIVSDICSPAALALPCLLLGVWISDVPGTYQYALLYFLVAVPLPLAYVVWLVRTGRVTDFHLPVRSERTGPFVASLASALAAMALLVLASAPVVFLAPIVAAFVQTLLLFAVTLWWQISVHTAATAGLATFASLALGPEATLLAALVPLVAWARVHLKRHTVAQTAAGALLGFATFAALFAVRGIAW